MNGKMRKAILALVAVLALPLLSCGDSGNSVKAIINGQEYDLNVENVAIVAGGVGDQVGGANLKINMSLSSGGYISDNIMITVQNLAALVPGQNYLIDGQNINATVQLNGGVATIFTGSSQIVFDSISNRAGGNVSGQFKIDLGGSFAGTLLGSFSGDVNLGY